MEILPLRSCARRMAILILPVALLDASAVFLAAKPQLLCARIPALIPLFTPAVIFTRRAQPKG
jgi:hypothetical protein